MIKIICSELTGEVCDFVVENEDAEEAKKVFYQHGAESPIHKEAYENVSDEDKAAFGQKLDEYAKAQK